MFSVYPFLLWWLSEYIYTLSYYHHQIGSMNYYPLFMVRSWNNGARCMSFYILINIYMYIHTCIQKCIVMYWTYVYMLSLIIYWTWYLPIDATRLLCAWMKSSCTTIILWCGGIDRLFLITAFSTHAWNRWWPHAIPEPDEILCRTCRLWIHSGEWLMNTCHIKYDYVEAASLTGFYCMLAWSIWYEISVIYS